MENFKLSRITSKFDRGIYKIYQFGYDDEGNFVTKVDNFKDYFSILPNTLVIYWI